jgi:hypothetical protein
VCQTVVLHRCDVWVYLSLFIFTGIVTVISYGSIGHAMRHGDFFVILDTRATLRP